MMFMKSSKKGWKGKERKYDDVIMKDARESDIIIPILGATGVGKSTFINAVAGKKVAVVGHDLQSCTTRLCHVAVPCPSDRSRRIIFVDTPGFDDTYIDDLEILRRIAVWLAYSYSKDARVAGIIHLHEISQNRMYGSTRKNFTIINKLCGTEACQNVMLVTTKWQDVSETLGRKHEEQLRSTFWKDMIGQGSRMARFQNDTHSAWEIIKDILPKSPVPLQIQRELVDEDKMTPETDAGASLKLLAESNQSMNRR
ncbi:P-loop containing nucleoside triphosphate hydrolase protein [Hygrophoropsis aurantiaca]|uniref:P-loop containing nucleoside triphosphate hydrolase protein n=1 Tax=Hygrophoropsis aurantiaca TaxID=72124 RepID=A0ACB8A623_9AGAM|nr:P-loop containing nucleoside triphosphate hydrolase protein [Hygrophoropsis aurantiaca]